LLIRDLPIEWATPPSGANFHVSVVLSDASVSQLGVISLNPAGRATVLSSF